MGAQRPIVIKLSRVGSVGPYRGLDTYSRASVDRSVQCIVEKRRVAAYNSP